LGFYFGFSMIPTVLACARRRGGPNGQVARNCQVETCVGVRLRRAQLRSRLVQFPTEVKITSARNTFGVTSEDDATSASMLEYFVRSVVHTDRR
jgi:hypothetical protein